MLQIKYRRIFGAICNITEKIKLYRDTEYRFEYGKGPITSRIETRSEALFKLYTSSGYACGVFISAYNPYGQAKNHKTNEVAHGRLGEQLNTMSHGVIECAGDNPKVTGRKKKVFFSGV